MKYESKNNYGFILLFLSGLITIGALMLLPMPWAAVVMVIGVAMASAGFYLMTRAFTPMDRDHPDYKQYMERFHSDPDDEGR